MMNKSVLFFSLLSGTALLPGLVLASGFPTHTLTNTPEPEPVSFIDMSHSYKTAAVCFLGYGDCDPNAGFGSGDENYSIDTAKQCQNEGFSKVNCNSVQVIDGTCPYNSSYGKGCKCSSNLVTCPAGQVGVGESCGGKYASCQCDPKLVSCTSNQVGQGASCGGKYQSCACKSEYVYNSSNCKSPRSLSGASCGGKYTGCSCPSGVSAGTYGCKEYYGSPCSSVCKTAYTDNCHKRTDNNSAVYGCMKYWADCSSKCETPYTDNCRNRTAVSCANGCASYYSDCSSKCSTCKDDPCANRTAVSCSYGCESYFSDCSSKCQACYSDNCRNRTTVISSCPTNATCSYFSDCSSKIQSWSCKSGYKKFGNTCILPKCNVGDIFYTDNTCVAAANHNSSKTALGIVVYMTDDGQHGQIMALWCVDKNGNKNDCNVGLAWGPKDNDVPTCPNITSGAKKIFDSCSYTDKIVEAGNAETYPAAWAARKYTPNDGTAGKWCLPAPGILQNVQDNWTSIEEALTKVNGSSLAMGYVWTPCEYSAKYAWGVSLTIPNPGASYVKYITKHYKNYYVRPVMEF